MAAFICGLIMGVPITIAIAYVCVSVYDRIHKEEPLTKDEWKVM